MRIELPLYGIAILNVVLWPIIQLGLAWGFTRMPVQWFDRTSEGACSGNAEFYERWLGIRKWKDRLPDGASWLGGGFSKASLASQQPAYLRRFIAETRRGELCHYAAFTFVPCFFLWNPMWGNWVIISYALLANLPCILAQRYNRIRIRRVLARSGRRQVGRCRSA